MRISSFDGGVKLVAFDRRGTTFFSAGFLVHGCFFRLDVGWGMLKVGLADFFLWQIDVPTIDLMISDHNFPLVASPSIQKNVVTGNIHLKNAGFKSTTLKINMEPENGALDKEIPFGNHHEFRFHVSFQGCMPFYSIFDLDLCSLLNGHPPLKTGEQSILFEFVPSVPSCL